LTVEEIREHRRIGPAPRSGKNPDGM